MSSSHSEVSQTLSSIDASKDSVDVLDLEFTRIFEASSTAFKISVQDHISPRDLSVITDLMDSFLNHHTDDAILLRWLVLITNGCEEDVGIRFPINVCHFFLRSPLSLILA